MSEPNNQAELPEIARVLRDPAASYWLKAVLRSALPSTQSMLRMIPLFWPNC